MSSQVVTSVSPTVAAVLRRLAGDVRRIGDGYRTNPEAIAAAKSEIAAELVSLARQLETRP